MRTLFYHSAEWCAPCKTLRPKVEALCKENGIAFFPIDIDDPKQTPLVSNILGVPVIAISNSAGEINHVLLSHEARMPNIKKALGL